MDLGLKARQDKAYERGQFIGRLALSVAPLVLICTAPRFWTDDYPLAGGALVIGHLVGFLWLPDAIGEKLRRRQR